MAVTGALAGRTIGPGGAIGTPLSWTAPSPTAEAPDTERTPTVTTGSGTTGDHASGTIPATVPGTSADGLTPQDLAAGLLSTRIPEHGTGHLATVPGAEPAPGAGSLIRVRVEVEHGLDVDGETFAHFVMATLNDPRGWGHAGRRTFARTSAAADLRVVLASPGTSRILCSPLRTMGTFSCANGGAAVLTHYRWVKAIEDYGDDRTGYRRYVVNHEVGHLLGHAHERCPGPGHSAPVMMQQTKGLRGCDPNPWPWP
jgi:hypothetical protein